MRRQFLGATLAFFTLLSLFVNISAGNTAINLNRTASRSLQVEAASWPMAGANPERTSWTPEEVRGDLKPLWYKPFEPYISQKVQVIAAYNTLYISTARGLYALDAENGAQRWVYPTALPLGHSPTIHDGVAYVGGLDHKLYAIDAFTGQGLWAFEAGAGFETNPLVVADKVYVGNRDGVFYAVYTEGPQIGQLAWQYQTEGPILFSAAYKDGLLYFASQDSHAYALDAQSGALVWKSDKLPGAGFYSFWPVVYRDRVIFAGSRNYHTNSRYLSGGKDTALETQDIYPNRRLDPDGTLVGPVGREPGDWTPGTSTLDASRPNVTPHGQTTPITEYFETKPWRRTVFVMDSQSGREVTYDFDGDGRPEYAPFLWFGTHSGNRYPPVVGGDGVLYMSNNYQSSPAIPWGHITGWKLDTPYLSLPAPGRNAIDEPQGYAAGGKLIYWNRCCDRVGAAFDLSHPGTEWTYFSYNLDELLPGYNQRYYNPDPVDYTHVFAAFGGPNGVYGFHADTNPPIPYHGKVYMHRSNAIIAFGPSNSAPQALPLAETVTAPPPSLTPLGPDGLKAELAQEIQKMLDAGHLRPGYVSHGHFDLPSHFQCGDDLGDYFHHPADTILTLIQALPYLPESMQPQVKAYLQNEFNAYPPYQYNHIGWQNGAAREAFDLPPEVAGAFVGLPPQPGISGFVWGYNPYSLYALWQYAALQNDPALAQQLLASAQNNRALMGSLRNVPNNGTLAKMPFVHNAYIAGYLGYLGLEKLAGQPESSQMRQELDRLMQLRASQFSKDSAYATAFTRETGAYCRTLNVASNFMFLVPELADYLREHALTKVQEAVAEYEQIAPYWFVSLTEEGFGENALNPLYDSQALFLAKAWILGEDGAQLEPYLDVPAFARGDLFYIQKLVVALKNYPTNPPVPSTCNNIALGKLTNASGTSNGPGLGSPQVVDGDPTTLWNAGGFRPQWIEINLGTPSSIDRFRLHVAQFPQGDTTHEIWVADSSKVYTKLETVSGFTTDGEVLDRAYNPSLTSIQWVKVITTASPSWVAWYEIQVCQTTTPVSTPIPSACNNIALGKPTNGSEAYDVLGQVPSQAVDGSPTTLWNAGNFSPQWLEVDLDSPTSIGGIRLQVSQYPAGNTTHEIWVADSSKMYTKVETISGFTTDGLLLNRAYNPSLASVQWVKVITTASPSWVAWYEIQVCQSS